MICSQLDPISFCTCTGSSIWSSSVAAPSVPELAEIEATVKDGGRVDGTNSPVDADGAWSDIRSAGPKVVASGT